jgi:hypothetical protein
MDLVSRLQWAAADSPDLLRMEYRLAVNAGANPLTGHCYVVTEALWHALGVERRDWCPETVRHEGSVHWYLRNWHTREIIDATASQFDTPPPYDLGRRRGFLTRQPSRRARELLRRAGL